MNIKFGNIKFGQGIIGIYGKQGSGRTAIRQYITESILDNGGQTFTNRFSSLNERSLARMPGCFHFFDSNECDLITHDDLFYISNHCMQYNQTAFVFGTARHLRPEQSYKYHLFSSSNEMRTYDQVHIIQDMKLTTLKSRFGEDDFQVFDIVKRGYNKVGSSFTEGERFFAQPCEESTQFTTSQNSVCPECNGAKQILMLDSFVSCKLCE